MFDKILNTTLRSTRSQTFFKIVVLKNFANFTGKSLYWSLFLIFDNVKQRLQHRCFPVKFAKFLRKTFFTEHLRRLLQTSTWWSPFQNNSFVTSGWMVLDLVSYMSLAFSNALKIPKIVWKTLDSSFLWH